MWQICNRIRLLFGVLGWLTLHCWEGKGKSVAHSAHSPKKMCGETPQGPGSGTSDMHKNNKTACCNTGVLAAAAEWETDVCSSSFNLNNSGTVWELFPSIWHTHSLDDSLLGHWERYRLTKTGWFENGDVSCQFSKLTNVNQTKLSIQPKLGSETQF